MSLSMEEITQKIVGVARNSFNTAVSSVRSASKVLVVDDELFCSQTGSSPFLEAFLTADELRRFYRFKEITSLSSFSNQSKSRKEASAIDASHVKHKPQEFLQKEHRHVEECLVFLVRPNTLSARHIVISLQDRHREARKVLVLMTPRISAAVERILRSCSQWQYIHLVALPIGFLPADDGLLTLFWPRAFSEVVLEGNNACILAAADALQELSAMLDVRFSAVRSAGAAGVAVIEEFQSHEAFSGSLLGTATQESQGVEQSRTTSNDEASSPSWTELSASTFDHHSLPYVSEIEWPWFRGDVSIEKVFSGLHIGDSIHNGTGETAELSPFSPCSATLLCFDRNVDLVTPLLIQWTYEGLLDEATGLLRGNVVDIGISDFSSQDAATMLGFDAREGSELGESHGKSTQRQVSYAVSSTTEWRNKRIRRRLSSTDDVIFKQLRDVNYWAAARLLGSVASSVQAYYDARPGRETAEIGQVKDYVRGLREVKNEHRNAVLHTALAAEVSARTLEQPAFKRRFEVEREMLEGSTASGRTSLIHDFICKKQPLAHVLRLCCLWSLTGGGIDTEAFEFLRREIVATYGLFSLRLLGNLERSGMFVRSNRASVQNSMPWNPFAKLSPSLTDNRKAQLQIPERENTALSKQENPVTSQFAAVGYSWQFVRAAMRLMLQFDPDACERGELPGPYAGYIPFTARLAEAALSESGWGKLPRIASHTMLLPPGHHCTDHSAKIPDEGKRPSTSLPADKSSGIDAVVLFIGGIARAEASAIRVMASKLGKSVIIAATEILSGDEFVLMR